MALRGDEPELMNLRDWDRRARLIRQNQTSRRFSASYIGSFREDHHNKSSSSSRTNFNNISSTASSPGFTLKEEIDPSTYSFTNALKALQAKTVYNSKEWLGQEGFELNSKWNEAEKYICNPFSGEVPMECLSSKTLSARSFRNLTTTPLHLSNSNPLMNIGPNNTPNVRIIHEDLYAPDPVLVREKKVVGLKRDVGIQSTSVDLSSGSPSPAKTPPITERSIKRHVEANDSPPEFYLKLQDQQEDAKIERKVKEEKLETSQGKGEDEKEGEEKQEMNVEEKVTEEKKKKRRGSGCFSWVIFRQRQARKSKYIFPVCVPHLILSKVVGQPRTNREKTRESRNRISN